MVVLKSIYSLLGNTLYMHARDYLEDFKRWRGVPESDWLVLIKPENEAVRQHIKRRRILFLVVVLFGDVV